MKVDGFNEYYVGYGGDDTDYALRLCSARISRFRMKHYGVLRHFKHGGRKTNKRSEKFLKELSETLEEGFRRRPEYGLNRAMEELKTLRLIDDFYWKFS